MQSQLKLGFKFENLSIRNIHTHTIHMVVKRNEASRIHCLTQLMTQSYVFIVVKSKVSRKDQKVGVVLFMIMMSLCEQVKHNSFLIILIMILYNVC